MTGTSRKVVVPNIRRDDPHTSNNRWPPHRELQAACNGYPLDHALTCFDPPAYRLPATLQVDGSLARSVWDAIDPGDENWRDTEKLNQHRFAHYSANRWVINSAFAQALIDLQTLLETLIAALEKEGKNPQQLLEDLEVVLDLLRRHGRDEDVAYANFATVLMQLATTLTLVKRITNAPQWVQDIDQALLLALTYPSIDPGGYSLELSYLCRVQQQNGQLVDGEVIAGVNLGRCLSWQSPTGSLPAVYLQRTTITTTYWTLASPNHDPGTWCELQLM